MYFGNLWLTHREVADLNKFGKGATNQSANFQHHLKH